MLFSVSGFIFAQKAPVKFSESVKNFGKVDEGKKIVLKYLFMNKGDAPLIINEVKSNCTCTHVDYSRSPINPEKVGEIVVTFDTEAKIGYQERKIEILTNLGNTEIRFKGVVKATDQTKEKYKTDK